jgi:hypothetical protein
MVLSGSGSGGLTDGFTAEEEGRNADDGRGKSLPAPPVRRVPIAEKDAHGVDVAVSVQGTALDNHCEHPLCAGRKCAVLAEENKHVSLQESPWMNNATLTSPGHSS